MSEVSRSINPWVFHFQKLELELKCPLCLNLLEKPLLLPCNHIFCNRCVPESSQLSTHCPECQQHFTHQETRPASHMENILAIYKSLDSTFHSAVLPLLSAASPDTGSPASIVASVDQARKKLSMSAPKRQNIHSDALVVNNAANGIEPIKCSDSEELDVNHAPGMSPGAGSSPSSGDGAKGAVALITKPGIKRVGTEIHEVNKSIWGIHGSSSGELDAKDGAQTRELKRPKKLDYGLSDAILQSSGCTQQIVSKCDEECKSHTNARVCAFCHSSNATEATGPLQHYADGKQVERDETGFSKAITVHRKCIEWTPQIYFVGETIKNLKPELARASKLKCSSCGLKGAGLGCFAKSCKRSYHVPCAVEILGCRWDCDAFLMLCPAHKSAKFPSEKYKTRKHRIEQECSELSPKIAPEQNFWANSPNGPQEWAFCGSSLSSEDKSLLLQFASMCGATVFKPWNPDVTHVIAATDSNGAYSRTLKVLMAILNGRWILTMDWVKTCVEAMGYVDEEPYEANLDNHGFRDGAKTGRLRASSNVPKLFHGLNFCLNGDFIPSYKNDLIDLVRAGGGIVIDNIEDMVERKHDQQLISTTFVVYNKDVPKETFATKRLAEVDDVIEAIGGRVIPHTWILESIAACRLLPVSFC